MADKPTYEELKQRVEGLEQVESKYKQLELDLKDSDKKSRAWLEHSPVCTKIIDLDFNLQYMSSAGIQGLGIEDITQYYGKPYPLDFYPESFRNTMTKNLEKVRETGEIIAQEAPVIDLEENEVWFHSTIVPVNDEKGRIEYFMVVSVDITDRKQAEEKRMQLTTAIEQADETIVITDKQGGIIYTNPAFEHITGFTPEETIGQNINIVKSDKNDTSFYEKIWDTISMGQRWKGYLKNKKKDGTLYDNAATISPIKDSQGEITTFVNIGRDVTHEIKREEQLRQSQKMDSIGTLAGGIAHDFNNLLSAIIGFTELSIDEVEDRPSTHESLKYVLEAADRAKDLVGQIRTFSRSKTLNRVQIKTTPIVKEVCKFIRSSLPTTIEIRQQLTAKNDWIMSDPTQFQQILMNLCTNAGHAMMETGGVLEILLEETVLNEDIPLSYPDLKPGAFLKLSVKDTGYGISKENLERIFEPYFTTKELGEGTGLGLAVVHGIVKDYGGDINVYSEIGKGTVFHVLLPLIEGAEESYKSDSYGPLPTGREAIMLVDDEELLVKVGTKMLERLGYRVTGFTSPEKALDMFKSSKDSYDLIITDKTMPKMTGLDLAEGIKKVRPDIPILLCTGFQDKNIDDKVKKAGITEYIMKPLNKREMAVAVRKVLGKKTS